MIAEIKRIGTSNCLVIDSIAVRTVSWLMGGCASLLIGEARSKERIAFTILLYNCIIIHELTFMRHLFWSSIVVGATEVLNHNPRKDHRVLVPPGENLLLLSEQRSRTLPVYAWQCHQTMSQVYDSMP